MFRWMNVQGRWEKPAYRKDWRVLLARRRAARPGEAEEWSTLPVLGGVTTFNGPIRYQALALKDADPTAVKLPHPGANRRKAWRGNWRRSIRESGLLSMRAPTRCGR